MNSKISANAHLAKAAFTSLVGGVTLLLACTGSSVQAAPPAASEPHVHGRARLLVTMDEKVVQVVLDSPLYNLLGFERPPKTEKEQHAVRKMLETLQATDSVLVFPEEAQCSSSWVNLYSSTLPARAFTTETDSSPENRSEVASGRAHGDLTVEFHYTCATPPTQLTVKLFGLYSRLKRLDAEVISPGGQSATRLLPQKNVLTLE